MSLGPVMVDLEGLTLRPEERERLLHPQTGGVVLFTRNFESPAQLAALTREIHVLREPQLIVAVDQEGGRVQRFHNGFTELPALGRYGELFDQDPHRALEAARTHGWLMAAELRACGVDLSFAPVLDLKRGVSGVIGDRAFHRHPEVVQRLAQAMMHGMKAAGMAAVGKHFPGHGSVAEDSHVAHPVDWRRFADIEALDLVTFERMVHFGVPGIMASHVVYPDVDDTPAGFSRNWIEGVLRTQLGFQGAVFTDDLSMEAAARLGPAPERARRALEAGCDMALVCNHPEAAEAVLQSLEGYTNPASQVRLTRMHGQKPRSWAELAKDPDWQAARDSLAAVDDSPWLEMDV